MIGNALRVNIRKTKLSDKTAYNQAKRNMRNKYIKT